MNIAEYRDSVWGVNFARKLYDYYYEKKFKPAYDSVIKSADPESLTASDHAMIEDAIYAGERTIHAAGVTVNQIGIHMGNMDFTNQRRIEDAQAWLNIYVSEGTRVSRLVDFIKEIKSVERGIAAD